MWNGGSASRPLRLKSARGSRSRSDPRRNFTRTLRHDVRLLIGRDELEDRPAFAGPIGRRVDMACGIRGSRPHSSQAVYAHDRPGSSRRQSSFRASRSIFRARGLGVLAFRVLDVGGLRPRVGGDLLGACLTSKDSPHGQRSSPPLRKYSTACSRGPAAGRTPPPRTALRPGPPTPRARSEAARRAR